MGRNCCIWLTFMAILQEKTLFSLALNFPSWMRNMLNADFCLAFFQEELIFLDITHASTKLRLTKKQQLEVTSILTISEHTLMKHQFIAFLIFQGERISSLLGSLTRSWEKTYLWVCMTTSKKYVGKMFLFQLFRNKNRRESEGPTNRRNMRKKRKTRMLLIQTKTIVKMMVMIFRTENFISSSTKLMKIGRTSMKNWWRCMEAKSIRRKS